MHPHPTATHRRRMAYLKALGPLTVCVISIALMNIFNWYEPKDKPYIKPIGNIPSGERAANQKGTCNTMFWTVDMAGHAGWRLVDLKHIMPCPQACPASPAAGGCPCLTLAAR